MRRGLQHDATPGVWGLCTVRRTAWQARRMASSHRPSPEAFDTIVVGGGTAGCVVAARLAAAGQSVALVEAGPSDRGRPEVLEVRRWPGLLGGALDWDFTIEPQPRGNSAIRHSRARVLGGCSSHNSCIAFVPPDRDFVAWEKAGATGWGPAGVAPFFDRVRATVPMGPVPPDNPVNAAVLAACANVGLPTVEFGVGDWFVPSAGMFTLNVVDGIRQSASVAYLHAAGVDPGRDDPVGGGAASGSVPWGSNLHVFTDTTVLGLELFSGRCRGVRTATGVLAADEVVLAAGAFGSPQLLMLAGIGPAEHLQSVGIEPLVDLAGVGANLQDHPEGVVVWSTTQPVPEPVVQEWEVGIFARVADDAEGDPNLMFHLGLVPFDAHTTAMGYPTAPNGVSLTPNVCRSRSRGTVRLRSRHPGDVPAIDFAYFTDPEGHDEAVMVAGVELARRIMADGAMAPWIDRELAPGPAMVDTAELSNYVRSTANTVYHPVGTCRMGTDPATSPDGTAGAVVDPSLRVHGVEGLRVADASVFPLIPSVNPAITAMMVGERCADFIVGH